MKKLLWIAGLFLSINSVFADEGESPLKVAFKGQGRLRLERSDRTDYVSQRSAFFLRLRPEIRLSKGSDLSLFLQPQYARALGRPDFVGTSTTANGSQPTSGGTYDSSLGIHQATLEYRPSDNLQFTLGRQVLSYGNELVLSGLDWDNVGRSFDALKTRYTHASGWIDAFYSKLFAANSTATSLAGGDSDFAGVYAGNNFGTGLEATDLYLLYRRDKTTGTNREVFAVGVRIQAKVGAVDYRGEFTKEAGSAFTNANCACQIDIEGGWNFDSPAKVRVGLEVFHAGETYDQLYPLAHKYLGIADVFGRRNLQGGVLHLSATPMTGLTAQFDFHYFLRSSLTSPVFKLNGTSALGTGASSSRSVGSEADLILNYAITKELTATLGGAVLFPGDYLKTELGPQQPTFWYTQLTAQL